MAGPECNSRSRNVIHVIASLIYVHPNATLHSEERKSHSTYVKYVQGNARTTSRTRRYTLETRRRVAATWRTFTRTQRRFRERSAGSANALHMVVGRIVRRRVPSAPATEHG